MRAIYSLVYLLLLWGCNPLNRHRQSGDFAAFFTEEVLRYGGHSRATNAAAKLPAMWHVQSDANGFEVHVTTARFSAIEAFLRQGYGEPAFVGTNADGRPSGLYKALDIGVAIHFYGERDGVGINCLRGFKDIGEMLQKAGEK